MNKLPKDEGEMLESLIPKLTPARRNQLERMADEMGYPYDQKEYEYRPREYTNWNEVKYQTSEELEQEVKDWESVKNI